MLRTTGALHLLKRWGRGYTIADLAQTRTEALERVRSYMRAHQGLNPRLTERLVIGPAMWGGWMGLPEYQQFITSNFESACTAPEYLRAFTEVEAGLRAMKRTGDFAPPENLRELYRVVKWRDLSEQTQMAFSTKGNRFRINWISSATSHFPDSETVYSEFGDTLIVIIPLPGNASQGRNIDPISRLRESEILFPASSTFQVVDAVITKTFSSGYHPIFNEAVRTLPWWKGDFNIYNRVILWKEIDPSQL